MLQTKKYTIGVYTYIDLKTGKRDWVTSKWSRKYAGLLNSIISEPWIFVQISTSLTIILTIISSLLAGFCIYPIKLLSISQFNKMLTITIAAYLGNTNVVSNRVARRFLSCKDILEKADELQTWPDQRRIRQGF